MNSVKHSCSSESSVDIVRFAPDYLGGLSPSHRNRLIQAHARRLYSKLWRAPIPAQRRLEQQWQNMVAALSELYPALDWTQPQLQQELDRRAHHWWSVKGVKGKGVDW